MKTGNKKIMLRKPRLSDLKHFHEVFNDKEMAKQISGYPYPSTIAQSKKKLQEIIDKNNKGDYYEFAIIANKKFVGSIVLEKPSRNKKIFTLGYAVGRKYWGRGIATSAVKKITRFAINKLRLEKIVAGRWRGARPRRPGRPFRRKSRRDRDSLERCVRHSRACVGSAADAMYSCARRRRRL